jgi:hypothetical protein
VSRIVSLHTFCSIKGGVGKSTLAVVTAKLLAEIGRVPLLVDADLTGTSLADGLLLRAPRVELRPDGALDLDASPTGELYTLQRTLELRHARKASLWKERPPPPAYLNDALTYVGPEGGPDCRIDGMIWRHERDDHVRYLPSSPLPQDVSIGLGWIYNEKPFRWVRRFTWVLDALLHRDSTLTEIQWKVNPFLVTTPDHNDILPALEYIAVESARLPDLVPILNRSTESIAEVRADMRRRLGPRLSALGIEERLRSVDEMRATLGRVFIEQDLRLDKEVRALSPVLFKERS